MNFSEWLERELKERGWSRVEAARRGDISASMFDKVINGHSAPGPKFLDGIAKAFKISPIAVYRAAGIFPPSKEDALVDELNSMMEDLPEEEKQNIYEYARMRRRILEERESYQSKRKPRPI